MVHLSIIVKEAIIIYISFRVSRNLSFIVNHLANHFLPKQAERIHTGKEEKAWSFSRILHQPQKP